MFKILSSALHIKTRKGIFIIIYKNSISYISRFKNIRKNNVLLFINFFSKEIQKFFNAECEILLLSIIIQKKKTHFNK